MKNIKNQTIRLFESLCYYDYIEKESVYIKR